MANNYRFSGHRLPVASLSADATSGQLVVQEGFFGIALTSGKSGGSIEIGADGVWNIPVPSGTVKGNRLFAANFNDAINPTLTNSAPTGKVWLGTAVSDRDSSNNALVLLAPQATDVLS